MLTDGTLAHKWTRGIGKCLYLFWNPAVFACSTALLIQESLEVDGLYTAAAPVFVSNGWLKQFSMTTGIKLCTRSLSA